MNTLDLMECAMRFPSFQDLCPTQNFIPIEFDGNRNQAGLSNFICTAKHWIDSSGAIGFKPATGHDGGNWVHKDAGFDFGSSLSPEFKFYLPDLFPILTSP